MNRLTCGGKKVNLPRQAAANAEYNIVLLPWPLTLHEKDFRPEQSVQLQMDGKIFGFFEFSPQASIDLRIVSALIELARARCGTVDAVLLH
jgi:hypothetical protein